MAEVPPYATPWYDGWRLITTVRSGWPATKWANRASLIAVSTDSDPPVVRNTRASGMGAKSASRAVSRSAGSLV